MQSPETPEPSKSLVIINLLLQTRTLSMADMLLLRSCSRLCRSFVMIGSSDTMFCETIFDNTNHFLKIFKRIKFHLMDISNIDEIYDHAMQLQNDNHLVGISFVNSSIQDTNRIEHFTSLKYLSVPGSTIDDDCLIKLHNMIEFSYINSKPNRITDYGLSHLSNLTSLNITCPMVTDVSVRCLTNLRKLKLFDNNMITGDCFTSLPYLQSLEIVEDKIIDDLHLGLATNLNRLKLLDCLFINGSALSKLINLTSLSVAPYHNIHYVHHNFNSDHLSNLTNLTRLAITEDLNILGPHLSYLINLSYLGFVQNTYSTLCSPFELTNLKALSIANSKLNLNFLSRLTQLTSIIFYDSDLRDEFITPLTNLETLSISLYNNNDYKLELTDTCLLSLVKIKYLTLIGSRLNFATFKHLRNLRHLIFNGDPLESNDLDYFPDLEYIDTKIRKRDELPQIVKSKRWLHRKFKIPIQKYLSL